MRRREPGCPPGTKPGPVLALTAGVHGQGYTPVLALQRLLKSLDAKSLPGAVILVHVVNMPSYLSRTIYDSPADSRNLNRVFPGRAARCRSASRSS